MNPATTEELLSQAGNDWTIQRMKGLQKLFDGGEWLLGERPSLGRIEQIDLCGLQLLLRLRRATRDASGRCDYCEIPKIVLDAAQDSGLDRWLGFSKGVAP